MLATGNLKYDIPCRQVTPAERAALRKRYAIPEGMTVITAASTHPGEEELVLAAYRELLATHGPLMLVLVPRHPERAAQVAGLLEKGGVPFLRRTALATADNPLFSGGAVLLVDTVGELMDIYALSDLAFVGGSLVATGGHNLLEPASVGVPSIFGPHMANFREIAALVLKYRAGIQVDDTCRPDPGMPQPDRGQLSCALKWGRTAWPWCGKTAVPPSGTWRSLPGMFDAWNRH